MILTRRFRLRSRRHHKVKASWTPASLCGRRLAEKDPLGFLRDSRLRIDVFCLVIGTHNCRSRPDTLKPSVQARKVLQLLTLAFVGNDPWINRHVGDGVFACDEVATGKPLIEDAIEAARLVHVSVDRIKGLSWRIMAEMMVLTAHRTESAHLPEQPLGDLDLAAKVGMHELSGLFGQIEKDSSRFEYRDRLLPSL